MSILGEGLHTSLNSPIIVNELSRLDAIKSLPIALLNMIAKYCRSTYVSVQTLAHLDGNSYESRMAVVYKSIEIPGLEIAFTSYALLPNDICISCRFIDDDIDADIDTCTLQANGIGYKPSYLLQIIHKLTKCSTTLLPDIKILNQIFQAFFLQRMKENYLLKKC